MDSYVLAIDIVVTITPKKMGELVFVTIFYDQWRRSAMAGSGRGSPFQPQVGVRKKSWCLLASEWNFFFFFEMSARQRLVRPFNLIKKQKLYINFVIFFLLYTKFYTSPITISIL